MLESLNFEIFGAFAGILTILIWLLLYFKKRAEKAEADKAATIKHRLNQQDKQLEVLEATNELLSKMLSEKENDA